MKMVENVPANVNSPPAAQWLFCSANHLHSEMLKKKEVEIGGGKVRWGKALGTFQQSRCTNSTQTPFKGMSKTRLQSTYLNVSVNSALSVQIR